MRKRLVKTWLLALIVFSSLTFLCLDTKAQTGENAKALSAKMSIKRAAALYDITPREFAALLGLYEPVSKRVPMTSLGVAEDQLTMLAEGLEKMKSCARYIGITYLVAMILGAIYLMVILKKRKHERGTKFFVRRYGLLSVSLFVVAVAFTLGASQNPMQAVSRAVKAFMGYYPDNIHVIFPLVFFAVASFIVGKIVCGWGCPLGALQEIIYSIIPPSRLKKYKPPFWAGNLLRISLFITAAWLLYAGSERGDGQSLYHRLNAFRIFDFNFYEVSALATAALVVALSVKIYRPFCGFVCPFGLLSWLFERISIYRLTVDESKCNACGRCECACPTNAIRDRLCKKILPADCLSCGRCIIACNRDAVSFKGIVSRSR